MEIWSQTSWWVELIFNGLLYILPPLATAAIAFPLGLSVVKYAKLIWREFRPLVDEPSDSIPRLIAAKTPYTADQVSNFLVENIDAIIATLPEEAKPQGE